MKTDARILANKIAEYWYKMLTSTTGSAPIFAVQKLKDFAHNELKKVNISDKEIANQIGNYWYRNLHGVTNQNTAKQVLRDFIEKLLKPYMEDVKEDMSKNKAVENYNKIMDDDDFLEKKIKEISATGDVAGYQTPNAFTKSGKPRKDLNPADWETVEDLDVETLELSERLNLDVMPETPKNKVNIAIHEINRTLFELDRAINRTLKLKAESGINQSVYWKATKEKLGKIRERLNRINTKILKFGE